MKKLIPLLLSVLIVAFMPLEIVKAEGTPEVQSSQSKAQFKQKRAVITKLNKEISKMEAQINQNSQKVSDLYNAMFQHDPVPNDEKIAQIEAKEREISRIVQQVILNERTVARTRKELTSNISHQNYDDALLSFDRMIALLEKKQELLKIHNNDLKSYINFLELMKLK